MELVITIRGQDDQKKTVSVSSFNSLQDAQNYCRFIESLELKEGYRIKAFIADEYTEYRVDNPEFAFRDIVSLDDRSIQNVLRQADVQVLAKALKKADENVKNTIFKNMSRRAAVMTKEDIEYMGPVPANDVKDAQAHIVDIIRRLNDQGEINFVSGLLGEEKKEENDDPFTLDDIILLGDGPVKALLKRLEKESKDSDDPKGFRFLAIAMEAAGTEAREKIFSNMTPSDAKELREIIKSLGDFIEEDKVKKAQNAIIDLLDKMVEDGDIIIVVP